MLVKMLRVAVALCLLGVTLAGPPVSRSRSEIEKFREFLESSRREKGVVLSEKAINPMSNVWENSGKFQGDILLDNVQLEALVQQFSSGRNAYIWPDTKWPGKTIPYEFAADHVDTAQRDYILSTMEALEERTCIRFRPRNPDEFNYVLITTNPDGCYASVGYWAYRGVHTINLARDNPGYGCFNPVVIIHEWLHVIGFFHMQSTHDRDEYVRINWENIVSGMEYNFDIYDTDLVSNLGLPYEYESCMHYGPYAFTMNGRTTIDALRPHSGEMGQTSYVTGFDFWRVDRHYGCAAWRKVEDYQPYHFDVSDVQVNGQSEIFETEPVKADLPEPVKIADIPEPVKIAELPEPVKVAESPEPEKIADIPEPEKIADLPEPVKVAEAPELVRVIASEPVRVVAPKL